MKVPPRGDGKIDLIMYRGVENSTNIPPIQHGVHIYLTKCPRFLMVSLLTELGTVKAPGV